MFNERYILSLTEGDGAACCYFQDINMFFHKKFGNWFTWKFALVFNDVTLQSNDDIFELLQNKECLLNELVSRDEKD